MTRISFVYTSAIEKIDHVITDAREVEYTKLTVSNQEPGRKLNSKRDSVYVISPMDYYKAKIRASINIIL